MTDKLQKMPIHPMLTPYIKSIEYEIQGRDVGKAPLPYKVLPDLSIVMGFQYGGSLYILENNTKRKLFRSGMSGLQTQYKIFQAEDAETKTILIKFYPWAINILFNESAYHFTDQALGLKELLPNPLVSSLEEQVCTAASPIKLSQAIQHFLIHHQLANHYKSSPKQIIALAQQLMQFNKIDAIAKLANASGLSVRTLERRFKVVIGLSPKKFLRLSQFQKALKQLRAGNDWEHIVEHLHYYDQAHFINSFKQFSGTTPGQYMLSDL